MWKGENLRLSGKSNLKENIVWCPYLHIWRRSSDWQRTTDLWVFSLSSEEGWKPDQQSAGYAQFCAFCTLLHKITHFVKFCTFCTILHILYNILHFAQVCTFCTILHILHTFAHFAPSCPFCTILQICTFCLFCTFWHMLHISWIWGHKFCIFHNFGHLHIFAYFAPVLLAVSVCSTSASPSFWSLFLSRFTLRVLKVSIDFADLRLILWGSVNSIGVVALITLVKGLGLLYGSICQHVLVSCELQGHLWSFLEELEIQQQKSTSCLCPKLLEGILWIRCSGRDRERDRERERESFTSLQFSAALHTSQLEYIHCTLEGLWKTFGSGKPHLSPALNYTCRRTVNF